VESVSDLDIERFVTEGVVRLDHAFSSDLAAEVRAILWRDLREDPHDPATWSRPVVRLGMYADPPFVEAANTARLRDALDTLIGPGRWRSCGALGTFPVRFPAPDPPGDVGWHVDASFDFERPDFLDWRINVTSRGRALLLLMLFSDVGEADAPTRLRIGSHRVVSRDLAPAGDAGLTLRELAAKGFAAHAGCEERLATGPAGTVYLCHPFLVHSAQPHRGATPRFLAQPPILPATALTLDASASEHPVERAIRLAIG
jgi:hypothetical protein